MWLFIKFSIVIGINKLKWDSDFTNYLIEPMDIYIKFSSKKKNEHIANNLKKYVAFETKLR